MAKAPVIGVTLDAEEAGGYSRFPWYALRQNYAESISRSGGAPVMLAHAPERVADYLDLIDALVITGGHFDVDPALFGAAATHPTVKLKTARTAFEFAIVKGALERDLPILGICGGEQLLNVALGGTLVQHIPDEVPGALAHEQPNPRDQPSHTVSIKAGTRLRALVGADQLAVNSAHHQAVKDVAPGLTVNATASDGVIEGIEDSRRRFCLGVQWHPEFALNEGDARLMAALVAAAGR
jgi:putative glutamine amidotransferase